MQSLPLSRAATAHHLWNFSAMRSSAGALGAFAVLISVPLEVLGAVLGLREGILVHVFLGLGTLLVAYSAIQFDLPRWLTWAGFVVASALGAIFLLQALTELTLSESLRGFAYGVLGQWPEGLLGDLLIVWFFAPLLLVSRGRTRLVGIFILPIVVVLTVIRSVPGVALGAAIPAIVLLLIAYVWFLFASAQPVGSRRVSELRRSGQA
jgi:hypothetical protein